jgi:PPOX class probable F420-dependent enzyme
MTFDELGDAKYIALETFKKSGEGVITPLWLVGKEGKLYARTDRNTWKVKRLRNNKRIRVAKSDWQGKPEGEWFEGKARILENPSAQQDIGKRLAAKYGYQYRLINFYNKLRRRDTNPVILEMTSV